MQQYDLIYDPEIISTNTILEKKNYRHLNMFCFEFKFVDNGVQNRGIFFSFFIAWLYIVLNKIIFCRFY